MLGWEAISSPWVKGVSILAHNYLSNLECHRVFFCLFFFVVVVFYFLRQSLRRSLSPARFDSSVRPDAAFQIEEGKLRFLRTESETDQSSFLF